MRRIFKFLKRINLKTIYFNFRYLPLKQAIKIPILISNKVSLYSTLGKIIFECEIRTGLVEIGWGKIGIFDNKCTRSVWNVNGKVIFKGKTDIGYGSKISVGENGILIFGKNFTIRAHSSIVAHKKIEFGNDCLLSWDILMMDTDLHRIIDNQGTIINDDLPIFVGHHVWIGCRNLILKGASIPNNSVIGADSFVNKKLKEENCLYVGNPIRCVKSNITWAP